MGIWGAIAEQLEKKDLFGDFSTIAGNYRSPAWWSVFIVCSREVFWFFFYFNKLGWLGSILVSIVLT